MNFDNRNQHIQTSQYLYQQQQYQQHSLSYYENSPPSSVSSSSLIVKSIGGSSKMMSQYDAAASSDEYPNSNNYECLLNDVDSVNVENIATNQSGKFMNENSNNNSAARDFNNQNEMQDNNINDEDNGGGDDNDADGDDEENSSICKLNSILNAANSATNENDTSEFLAISSAYISPQQQHQQQHFMQQNRSNNLTYACVNSNSNNSINSSNNNSINNNNSNIPYVLSTTNMPIKLEQTMLQSTEQQCTMGTIGCSSLFEKHLPPKWLSRSSSDSLQEAIGKFQFTLMAPTSPAVKTNEDTLTYLNQGQNYELRLCRTDMPPMLSGPSTCNSNMAGLMPSSSSSSSSSLCSLKFNSKPTVSFSNNSNSNSSSNGVNNIECCQDIKPQMIDGKLITTDETNLNQLAYGYEMSQDLNDSLISSSSAMATASATHVAAAVTKSTSALSLSMANGTNTNAACGNAPMHLSLIRLCFWDRKLQEVEQTEIKEVGFYIFTLL
jgi:hypothetical protein